MRQRTTSIAAACIALLLTLATFQTAIVVPVDQGLRTTAITVA